MLVFQLEDDPSLMPESSSEGYQFDPQTTIPQEGFKFWLDDYEETVQAEGFDGPPDSSRLTSDNISRGRFGLTEGRTSSNVSVCGSDQSLSNVANVGGSEMSSDNGSVSVDFLRSDENFNSISGALDDRIDDPTSREHWGEFSDGNRGSNSDEIAQQTSSEADHAYSRASFSNDQELLSWYCLQMY